MSRSHKAPHHPRCWLCHPAKLIGNSRKLGAPPRLRPPAPYDVSERVWPAEERLVEREAEAYCDCSCGCDRLHDPRYCSVCIDGLRWQAERSDPDPDLRRAREVT